MARLRYNNQDGNLGADPGISGTNLIFSVIPDFATIVAPDYIPIALDPGKSTFEIVYLTAYTAGETMGTMTRAAEDASLWPAVAHPNGTWSVAATVTDFTTTDSTVYDQGGAWVNVKSAVFAGGAKGDNTTDDTAAIAAALATGLNVFFPVGRYQVRPNVLALPVSQNGQILMGAGKWKSRLVRSGNGILLDTSGSATGSPTHNKYIELRNMGFDGGGFTGTLVRAYYSGDNITEACLFYNTVGTAFDAAEYWDSRFINNVSESCGDFTNSFPVFWLRNSAATSPNFGYSTDNCNNVHFLFNRIEVFNYTALRIEQGVTNGALGNTFWLIGNKFESDNQTSALGGDCPFIYIGASMLGVTLDNALMFCNCAHAITTLISWNGGKGGSLSNIQFGTGSNVVSLGSGITMNSSTPTEVSNIFGIYNAAPTTAQVIYNGTGPYYRPVGHNTNLGTLESGNATLYPLALSTTVGGNGGGSTPALDSGNIGGVAQGTPTSPVAWTHTVAAGSNRILIVAMSYNGAGICTSVTFGGTPLTLLWRESSGINSADRDMDIWYLVAPAVGASTAMSAIFSPTASGYSIKSMVYTSVQQSAPFGGVSSAHTPSGTALGVSSTISSANPILGFLALQATTGNQGTAGGAPTTLYSAQLAGTNIYNQGISSTGGFGVSTSFTWGTPGAASLVALPLLGA